MIAMGLVSSYPSLKYSCVILISPIHVILLKILDCFSGSIGGLLTKVSQSMGSTIYIQKIDLISSEKTVGIKE